ncbi:MAG: penicillin-binding protein 2 [Pseudomonadales bacterium]|nr:penicillin-binding protein 2 [Pseudomonadales bacterium]MCP5330876.1 penicillin-binding protein 2 [Pseudomonadales bacterium]MCP5343256.1 penicillin-binding protein 2 [Pseudomonadales bacterium]
MAEKFKLDDHERETLIFNRRMLVAGVFIFLLISALVTWMVYLQVYRYDYFAARSDGNRLHSQYVPPNRGLIYDRNGVLLADNRPIFNLTVVRETATNLDVSLDLLRSVINLSDDDIEQYRVRQSRRAVPHTSVPLRYQLNEEEIANIAVNQHLLPGIAVEAQLVRHYPFEQMAAHAIGYVSEINKDEMTAMSAEMAANYRGTHQIGKTGIEKTYENLLHGEVGYETVEKNNRGQVMRVLDRTDPVPGRDIVLHLDAKLQAAAAQALGDRRGAVVAIEPSTGGVLAMVSQPGYDPNLFVTGISRAQLAELNRSGHTPLFNRAIASRVPGSTIKPFIGLAGLYNEVITPDTVINDPGYFRMQGRSRPYYDWTWWVDKSGHGPIDLRRAIYQSCNTYFYQLAVDLGIEKIHDYLMTFGFGRNAAIDIPEASPGIVPNEAWKLENRGEVWYAGETPYEGIGNGIFQATTLQMASAAAAIANHGVLKQPRMLRGTIGNDGEITDVAFPDNAAQKQLLPSQEQIELVRSAMVDVVNKPYDSEHRRHEGSAYPVLRESGRPLEYPMGGKSGTAQVVQFQVDAAGNRDDSEVDERFRTHAMFIAFDASENSRIAVAVFVENGGGGGSVAFPVARAVLDAYLLPEQEYQELSAVSHGH